MGHDGVKGMIYYLSRLRELFGGVSGRNVLDRTQFGWEWRSIALTPKKKQTAVERPEEGGLTWGKAAGSTNYNCLGGR